jgi:hypothetical protein
MGLIQQVVLVLTLGVAMAGADSRWAVRYNPNVMERVAHVRRMEVVPCMAAHPTYPLGTWLLIEGVDTGIREACRVTDVSHPRDRARHIRTRRIELSYAASLRICKRGWSGAARDCKVLVREL